MAVPRRPTMATMGVARMGPSAQPLSPPTANMLMPVPWRPPAAETKLAKRTASGWYMATPIDEITSTSPVAAYDSSWPTSAMPTAARKVPTGIIQPARMRSANAPSNGCRNDDPMLAKSRSAPDCA